MIWVALLIGATVLFSAWLGRLRPQGVHPRDWLVLPDEPPPAPLRALPEPAPRAALPALAAAGASWSGESWRADKPFRPWLQSPVPYAAAVAFGAVSLDLSALGMGVPEIFPTHLPIHCDEAPHRHVGQDHPAGVAPDSFEPWTPDPDALAGLFDAHHLADAGFLRAPSWAPPHAAGHDWWG